MTKTSGRAKYIGSTKTEKNYLEMMFEYRGHTYLITRPLSWTNCSSDYTVGKANSEKKQHEENQKLIDNLIDNPNKEVKPYNNEAEKAIEDFLNWCEQ